MILWIVDTSGWWRQRLWRICHTGCSKCESNQVSKIQTSEMAICKHDARGLPLLTLQWVLLFFIVLAHEVFGSSPLTTFPFLTATKKGKSKSHIVWHRKWCSRYRDCVLTKICFLLPFTGYWHQVRSYGSKNMAVSVLFSRLTEFDPTGCKNAKLEYTPLSDVNMVWTYPGHGPQTMGNIDPFEMKYVASIDFKNYSN